MDITSMNVAIVVVLVAVVYFVFLRSKGSSTICKTVTIFGNDKTNLSLAEVQVFGSDGKNVALGGNASQSSTDHGGVAARAIDGNTDGTFLNNSVTHTVTGSPGQFWSVDIIPQVIKSVVIHNRIDDCLGINCSERLVGAKLVLYDEANKSFFEKVLTGAAKQTVSI